MEPVSLEMFNKAATDLETNGSDQPQEVHQILDQEDLQTSLNTL